MDTLKRITVLLLAAALVYAGAAALHPPQARAGINAGVVVNNLASQPVPITGNVGINGTAMVQLAPGTTVGVTGGTFNFSNTPATPVFTRDKDNPTLSPFQTSLCVEVGRPDGIFDCRFSPFPQNFPVGANQRAVIEFVSLQCSPDSPGVPTRAALQTQVGGTFSVFSFPLGQSDGVGSFVFSQQVRIYADRGSFIVLRLDTSGGPFGGRPAVCSAQLSGNLLTP